MSNTRSPRSMNKTQLIIGSVALLIGAMVYLIDRPPEETYFISKSPITITLYNSISNLFGSMGHSLPAFLHVFSFILLTTGLIVFHKKAYLIICLFWLFIDTAFEVGQKFNEVFLYIIPDWFEGVPILENTKNYFCYGTFDVNDLAAIALGSLTAYVVMLATTERRALS